MKEKNRSRSAKGPGLLAAALALGVLGLAGAASALVASRPIAARALVKPVPDYVTPVAAGDTIADRVLGQFDFFHNTLNFVDAESLATNGANSFAGVVVDTSSIPNRIYVADQINNRVLGWASVAALSNNRPADIEIGQPDFFTTTCLATPSAASLCTPAGVAVDGLGNLYVADSGNNRVLEYNSPLAANGVPGSGDKIADAVYGQSDNYTTKLCNLGAPVGVTNQFGLCGPQGVALDAMGNLYVADNKNNRVVEYNFPSINTIATRVFGQAGSFTTTTANKGGVSANSLSGPAGIAFDSVSNLWVADSNNNRVLEYNTPLTNATANKVVGQAAFNANAAATPPTQTSLNHPVSVDLDSGNDLYVADQNNYRVLEYNNAVAATGALASRVFGQGGLFTTKTPNFGGLGANGLNLPSAVAVDGGNNLFVKDSFNNRVLKYNGPLSNQVADLVLGQPDFTHNAANEVDGGAFLGPNGVAIDTSVNPPRLWVADTLNNRVLGYNNAAAFLNGAQANVVLGQKDFTGVNEDGGGATPASGFDEPYGVAVDKLGHLYVLDSAHDRVLGYKLPITVNGQAPNMVFGEPDFVTASCNFAGGITNKGMCFPQGIAVDGNGNLFVGDTSNDRVLEYNAPFAAGGDNLPDHVFGPADFTSDGCAFPPTASSICTPGGVAADASNNIYIADSGDSRVVEFNNPVATLNFVADEVFGQPSFTSNSGGVTASLVNFPTGVAVDSLGHVYVVDAGNQRVIAYNTPHTATGNTATLVFGQFGSFTNNMGNFGGGPSPYSLDNPNGAAVDPSNNLYIADSGNNRVLGYNAPFASATPVPQPMTVTPPSLAFNKVNRGTISATQTLTVKNTGTAPIIFNGVSRSGGNVNDFAQSSNCNGNLAAGASCTVSVKFAPTFAAGTVESTTLDIWSNAVGSPKAVPISGTSAADPTATPASLPFGSVVKGVTSAAKVVTVTNAQTAAITVSSAIGGTNPGDFAKSATTCGATLAGGTSCTISVTFKPTLTGARLATLIVTTGSDPASPHNVGLTGTGT